MKYALPLWAFLALAGGQAMAYEEPEYEVVATFDDFELRQYAPYLIAETTVSGDFESAGNSAFGILADYIFDNNRGSEKMKMTTPVNQTADRGERMEMTAPVLSSGNDGTGSGAYSVSFVIPSKYTMDTVPAPVDDRVVLREVEGALVAAHRFSGSWKRDNYDRHEATLLQAVRAEGLVPASAPVFARYNAPFWPAFLRRNEILLEVR